MRRSGKAWLAWAAFVLLLSACEDEIVEIDLPPRDAAADRAADSAREAEASSPDDGGPAGDAAGEGGATSDAADGGTGASDAADGSATRDADGGASTSDASDGGAAPDADSGAIASDAGEAGSELSDAAEGGDAANTAD